MAWLATRLHHTLTNEIADSLHYNSDFGQMNAKSAISGQLDMQIDLRLPDRQQIAKSLKPTSIGITAYDSTYLAPAETDGMALYMADDRLLNKVAASGVKHIRDYDKPS